MKKLIKGTGLVLISFIMMSSLVLADPVNDKLKSQQDKLKQDKSSLQNAQGQMDTLEQSIEKMDEQIGNLTNDINKNKKQISSTDEDINKAEKDIESSEEDLQKSNDLFNQRLRAMYINGSDGYLELLLESKGISDLISRVEFVATMVNYDNKVISDIKAKEEIISQTKDTLQKKKAQLIALNNDNESKMAKVTSDKDSQSKLVAEAKQNEKVLALNVSASQSQVNETLQQIAEMRNVNSSTSSTTLSRGGSPISSNSVIAYASNFLGTPYVWGGTSPSGFDCSGFTQYVYAHFGVSLERTTYDQINEGVAVSRDNLQPGDLIFFGTWSDPHHVGIYAGNNTYIHAPHTGDVVKISSLTRSDFLTARRVR